MKKFFYFVLWTFFYNSCLFAQSDEWQLIVSKDGIDFYVAHRVSRLSPSINSIVKIYNTTGKQVMVMFTPAVACKVGAPVVPLKPENVYLNAEHATSLHNYVFCEHQNIPQVQILDIKIESKP